MSRADETCIPLFNSNAFLLLKKTGKRRPIGINPALSIFRRNVADWIHSNPIGCYNGKPIWSYEALRPDVTGRHGVSEKMNVSIKDSCVCVEEFGR